MIENVGRVVGLDIVLENALLHARIRILGSAAILVDGIVQDGVLIHIGHNEFHFGIGARSDRSSRRTAGRHGNITHYRFFYIVGGKTA